MKKSVTAIMSTNDTDNSEDERATKGSGTKKKHASPFASRLKGSNAVSPRVERERKKKHSTSTTNCEKVGKNDIDVEKILHHERKGTTDVFMVKKKGGGGTISHQKISSVEVQ